MRHDILRYLIGDKAVKSWVHWGLNDGNLRIVGLICVSSLIARHERIQCIDWGWFSRCLYWKISLSALLSLKFSIFLANFPLKKMFINFYAIKPKDKLAISYKINKSVYWEMKEK